MSKQNFSKEDIEYRAYKFFEEKGLEYVDNIDELIGYCRGFAYPLVSYFRKENRKLEKENADLKETNAILSESASINQKDLEYKVSVIEQRNKKIAGLEQQIEKMKSQYDYAFNQLCKSREILCSMLSQYRDRKEIDYSTRECGEKLLKEGVYKNDRRRIL